MGGLDRNERMMKAETEKIYGIYVPRKLRVIRNRRVKAVMEGIEKTWGEIKPVEVKMEEEKCEWSGRGFLGYRR